jgi:hypothetical protein
MLKEINADEYISFITEHELDNSINYKSSYAFFDYTIALKINRAVKYVYFLNNNLELVFHVLFRKPFFKGSISYFDPIIVHRKTGLTDLEIKSSLNDFLKKYKKLLLKSGSSRHDFNFLSLELSCLTLKVLMLSKSINQDTIEIELSKNNYDLGYNRSLQRTLNKFASSNIFVEYGNSKEIFNKYLLLYYQFELDNGRKISLPAQIELDHHYNSLPYEYYLFFIAYFDGKPLSVLGIECYNKFWTELGSSTSKYAFDKKIPASHILHDRVLAHASSLGVNLYDFAGLNHNTNDEKKLSINKFKLSFSKNVRNRMLVRTFFPHF